MGGFAQNRKISAAADPWPPFTDPSNPNQGFSIEVLKAALATQGYSLDFGFMPWARAEAGATNGEIDLLPDTWMTEARKAVLVYSEPYAVNRLSFIKLKGDGFDYKGIDSLKGKNIAVVRGYGYGDAFAAASNFTKITVDDTVAAVRLVIAGRADLTLEDEIVAKSILAKNYPEALGKIDFAATALSSNPLYVTAGIKNPRAQEIIAAFNKGLAAIKASGVFDRILKGYNLR
jgi:polar amino acid transport system substrate-binding protein